MEFSEFSQSLTYKIHMFVVLMDKIADQLIQSQLNLSYSSFLVIMAIDCGWMGEKVTQKKVADFLKITPAAVSRHIEPMAEQGILVQQHNPENRRENLLSLTEKGKQLMRQAHKILSSHGDSLFDVLSQEEREQFIISLHKLLAEVEKHSKN